MKSLSIMAKTLFGIAALMLLVGAWVSPAAAQTPEREFTQLEYGLKRALLRLDALGDRIENMTSAADLAEEYIQDEKDAGNDTTDMEAALADLRAKIVEAQANFDEAAQALDAKAGYDADGQVTDPQQARETLETANRAFQDANQALRIGAQDLRQAVRDYRQNKRLNR
ncbi:MAG: hypothetical protein KDI79_21995 [Anaerolineae bacterium]|nr:hypothetical protein [Anaerolineae bacterium]